MGIQFWILLVFFLFVLIILIRVWKRYYNQFSTDCRLIDNIGYGDNLEQLKSVIRDGANINGTDENGITPLMMAVRHNRLDVVKYLVYCGANINMKNKDGENVFDIARKHDCNEILEYLSSYKNKSAY